MGLPDVRWQVAAVACALLVSTCTGSPAGSPGQSSHPPLHQLVAAAASSTTVTGPQLPSALEPSHYAVTLNILQDQETQAAAAASRSEQFSGSVAITFKVVSATSEVVLNSVGHSILATDVKLELQGSGTGTAQAMELDTITSLEEYEMIVLKFKTELALSGEYLLTLQLNGVPYSEDLRGLFLAGQSTDRGLEKLVGTQFSPVYARRMIPCFDEPRFRATFAVTVNTDPNMVVLSNTALASASNATKGLYVFETTPAMPTYLLGIIVTKDMERLTSNDGLITMYGRGELVKKSEKTLQRATEILAQLASYTGKTHDFGKLGLVALDDHYFTAMENWGLITFRDPTFIFDEESSAQSQIYALTVLAHELAHQWFGNILTIPNWNNAWLKEGFATYFGYKAGKEVDSASELEPRFYSDVTRLAMAADAKADTHALNNQVLVGNSKSLLGNLDKITYNKGAAILNSFEHILKNGDSFKKGIQKYIQDNQYSTGSNAKLFSALEATLDASITLPSGVALTDMLSTWTDKTGFPVVHVTRDYSTKAVTFQQRVFHSTSEVQSFDDDKEQAIEAALTGTWWVPLSYVTSKSYSADVIAPVASWLKPNETAEITIEAEPTDWLLVNDVHKDFYRVNYDVQNWRLLSKALKSADMGKLSPVTRAVLVEDALALARASLLDISVCIELLDYLRHETHPEPWLAARAGFDELDVILRDTIFNAEYRRWQRALVTHALNETLLGNGRSRHSLSDRLLRGVIMDWACELGAEACLELAVQDFNDWLTNPLISMPSYDMLSATICTAMREASSGSQEATVFTASLDWLLSERDLMHRKAIIRGLGCMQRKGLILPYLSMPAEPNTLRRDEPALMYKSVARFGDVWEYYALQIFLDKFELIKKHSGESVALSIFVALAETCTTTDHTALLGQIEQMFDSVESESTTGSVYAASLVAQDNILWREDERLLKLGAAIQAVAPPPPTTPPRTTERMTTHPPPRSTPGHVTAAPVPPAPTRGPVSGATRSPSSLAAAAAALLIGLLIRP